MFHSPRLATLCAAVALALAATPVAAATSVPETFSVAQAITITGLPAAIDYGSNLVPGAATTPVDLAPHVQSNVPWRLDLTGSAFTGPTPLAASVRQVKADAGNWSDTFYAFGAFGNPINAGSATPDTALGLHLRLNLPSNALPGSYSGSVTFTIAAS